MHLHQSSQVGDSVYKGVRYAARGVFSPNGGYAAEYRVGAPNADNWVTAERRFDTLSSACEAASQMARDAIDAQLAKEGD